MSESKELIIPSKLSPLKNIPDNLKKTDENTTNCIKGMINSILYINSKPEQIKFILPYFHEFDKIMKKKYSLPSAIADMIKVFSDTGDDCRYITDDSKRCVNSFKYKSLTKRGDSDYKKVMDCSSYCVLNYKKWLIPLLKNLPKRLIWGKEKCEIIDITFEIIDSPDLDVFKSLGIIGRWDLKRSLTDIDKALGLLMKIPGNHSIKISLNSFCILNTFDSELQFPGFSGNRIFSTDGWHFDFEKSVKGQQFLSKTFKISIGESNGMLELKKSLVEKCLVLKIKSDTSDRKWSKAKNMGGILYVISMMIFIIWFISGMDGGFLVNLEKLLYPNALE